MLVRLMPYANSGIRGKISTAKIIPMKHFKEKMSMHCVLVKRFVFDYH